MNLQEETTRKYKYHNRLSETDRYVIAFLYIDGFAIYNIANQFRVTPTSIQWHLVQMGVYVKNKRPTQWNKRILEHTEEIRKFSLRAETLKAPQEIIDLHNRFIRQDAQDRLYEFSKPARYVHIQRKQAIIRKTLKRNDLAVSPRELNKIPFKVMLSFEL